MKKPLFGILTVWALLLWSAQGCVKPTEPPQGKDSVVCDTCKPDTVICDTCTIDTTDTIVVVPGDSTSHNFSWQDLSVPGESKLTACAVFGEKEMYVLGGDFHKWDGVSFTKPDVRRNTDGLTLQGRGFFADMRMFAFNPDDLWIFQGSILYHITKDPYDGYLSSNEHRLELSVVSGFLNAAWGTSSRDLFVVGNNGAIIHFNGETWTKMESGTTRNLRSVWGTSHSDVWAAGYNSSTAESVLLHYNGSQWQEIDLSSVGLIGYGKHALQQVWTVDSANSKITIASGSLIWRKKDNGAWTSDSGRVPNRTSDGGFIGLGVRGNSSIDMFAVGGWGFIAHWNGKNWHKYDQFFNAGDPFYGVSGLSIKGNTVCAVGSKSGGAFVYLGQRP